MLLTSWRRAAPGARRLARPAAALALAALATPRPRRDDPAAAAALPAARCGRPPGSSPTPTATRVYDRPRPPGDRPGRALRAVVDPRRRTTTRSQTVWRSPGGRRGPAGRVDAELRGPAALPDARRSPGRQRRAPRPHRARRPAASTAGPSGCAPRRRPPRRTRSGCWYNPYSLGSVQGVQEGWATPVLGQRRPLQLPPGTYDVTAPDHARRTPTPSGSTAGRRDPHASRWSSRRTTRRPPRGRARRRPRRATAPPHEPEPAAGRPARAPAPCRTCGRCRRGASRSSGNGDYLQFSATVWNGGDSPLVVDGFRRDGEDEMDAYQYFFDGDGNQTGYQQVGQHALGRPPHAPALALRGLRPLRPARRRTRPRRSAPRRRRSASPTPTPWTRRSRTPTGTPRTPTSPPPAATYGSLSIREVLASGWGDTYAQFRAGQSFDLEGLPERHLLHRGDRQPRRPARRGARPTTTCRCAR